MKLATLIASLALSSAALAADNAKSGSAKTPASAAPAAAAQTLTVDTAKSKILWKGTKKAGSGHNGEIAVKSGTVSLGEKSLTGGEIIIDMPSLTVTDIPKEDEGNGKLEKHLENADFFDVEKYPTAKLVISSAKALGGDKHQVKGKVTIKDVTKDVTFPVTVRREGSEAIATGTLKLDRTAFGVKYGSANFFKLAADKIINNEFELDFNVVAK